MLPHNLQQETVAVVAQGRSSVSSRQFPPLDGIATALERLGKVVVQTLVGNDGLLHTARPQTPLAAHTPTRAQALTARALVGGL